MATPYYSSGLRVVEKVLFNNIEAIGVSLGWVMPTLTCDVSWN